MTSLPKPKSNSFFSNSFLIFITRFFPALANLGAIIYFSRQMPTDAYGAYQGFWIQFYTFYPIVCIGIHLWMVTYKKEVIIALFERIKAKEFLVYATGVVILSAIFGLLQYHAPMKMFLVPFIFLAITPITTILESFLIINKSYALLIITNILYAAAYFGIHWYIINHDFSLTVLFTWILIIVSIKTVFYIIASAITYRKSKINTDEQELEIPQKTRSLLMHIGIFDILQMLANQVDKFIISLVLTADQTAIYINGSQNVPFLPLLLTAAGSSVLMQLAHVKSENETAKTIMLMQQAGRVLSCIVFPVFFYTLIFRYELLTVVFTDKYIPAVPVFFYTTLVLPVRAYSYTTVLQKLHKGAIINAGSLIELLLACALMYPMYRLMGLCGVALSFVVTTYLQAGFYIYHTARLLKVNPLSLLPLRNWALKLVSFAVIFLSAYYLLGSHFKDRIILILGGVLMAVVVLLSLLMELKVLKNGTHQPSGKV